MSNIKQYSLYNVVSKDTNAVVESSLPTRKEARIVKREHGNALIE